MLVEIKVTHFAIIQSLHLQFYSGLNILSGETGAGKSILFKCIALLMGEKAHADTVRLPASFATIEGVFDLEKRQDVMERLQEMGIDTSDEQLVIRRVITPQGRSRVYLNGSLASLHSLKEIVTPLVELTGHQATPLIEMTGQHDNRYLQSRAYHLDLLDRFAGTWDLRREVELKYRSLKELQEKWRQFQADSLRRDERLEMLTFQQKEISSLSLQVGEEEELQNRYLRAKNSSRLVEFINLGEEVLYGGDDSVLVQIHRLLQRGYELATVDEELSKKVESLSTARTLIEDCVYELREYGRSLETDTGELERWEQRLTQVKRVLKKYGGTVEEVLNRLQLISDEIKSLENFEESLQQFSQEQKILTDELHLLAQDLHQKRKKAAALLIQGVNTELQDLNMKGLLFGIHLKEIQAVVSTGISEIEFTTQSGSHDTPRPLAKFASGGELSRILLALKRVIGLSDWPRTYLFDEVDAGVSGLTAEKVGRKLRAIARGQQIICVTHLPQVAAFADHHYLIQKSTQRGGDEVHVSFLEHKEQKVDEIARLISGTKITPTSRKHARVLIAEAINPD